MKILYLCEIARVENGWLVTIKEPIGTGRTLICPQWDDVLKAVTTACHWVNGEAKVP